MGTPAPPRTEAIQELREELARLSHRLVELTERVERLELRDEMLEMPAAAGDEPPEGMID